jgi:hypothetical protein
VIGAVTSKLSVPLMPAGLPEAVWAALSSKSSVALDVFCTV